MKRVLLITTALNLLFAISCKENNKNENSLNVEKKAEIQAEQIAAVSFSNEMTGKVFEDYQKLRKALINSDSKRVQTAASNLADGFSEEHDNMKLTALAMAEANDLEKQRHLFSIFTEKVEPMFEETIAEGTIYKQYCPMAFEGEGGYWFSNLEEIRNPYYGDKMLKCGKVLEEIR